MALKRKVLGVSVLAGLLLWVADAVVDSLFFHEQPFVDLLILAVPPHEIYVRSLGFAIVLTLGFVLAVQFAKRERIQREVRKSRGFLQTVIDAIPAATMVIGRDYKVALANQAVRDVAGGKDSAASRLTCHQVSHHRDRPCSGEEHPCPLKEIIATKAPVTVTHTHYDAEGNEEFAEITAAPIFDDAGEVTQIIESCRDITDRKQSAEALRESEKKYRHLFEHLVDAAFLADAETGMIVEANQQGQKLLGRSRDEIVGMHQSGLHPPDKAEQYKAMFGEHVGEGRTVDADAEVVRKDGTTVPVHISATTMTIEGRRLMLGIFHDITKRKQAEQSLRESEQKYRQLVSSLHEGVWVIDADSRTTFVNERMADMLGYAVEEMMGRSLFSFMDQQGKQIAERNIKRRRGGIREQHEFEFLRKDGTRVHTLLATAPITDEAGPYAGAIAGVLDITERKRAQEQIADLAKFPSENPYPVLRIATDGEVLYANTGALGMLEGLESGRGKPAPEQWRRIVSEALESGSIRSIEVDHRGSVFAFWAVPVADGGYVNWYGVDISERKQAEQELADYHGHLEELVEQRTAELKVANKELESFSYSVSHDLRTPLRGIGGFTQALKEEYADKLGPQGRDYLDRVLKGSGRMTELIDDLLRLSGVTLREMKHETVDLSALAGSIAGELRKAEPARQVRFDVEPGLIAHGDVALLRLALQNLMNNAWKFTGGRDRARIEFGALEHDGGRAYFVRDDGVGFDMAYVDKLFIPFQRLHPRAEFSGTGIGLATVSRIIGRHGGKVWGEGQAHKGATFYFTL